MSRDKVYEQYQRIAFRYECVLEALDQRGLVHPDMVQRFKDRFYDTLATEMERYLLRDDSYEETIRIFFTTLEVSREYVSLTELARRYSTEAPGYVIQSWMRSRNTVEFLRIWELTYNNTFKDEACAEMLERRDKEAYTITPSKWVSETKAKGILVKRGKGGGITAHPDIALDFRMWLDPNYRHHVIWYVREH